MKFLSSCLLFSLGLAPACSHAEPVKLLIQEYAPFTHTDVKTNEITGVLTEKIQEIIKRAGDTSSITSTSLARGLSATLNDENTCLFGFRRTPERENAYKWIGPLITDNWVLYSKKGEARVLKSLEDAKPYSIGSYRNAATGLQLFEQGYKIEFSNQDEDNPRLLINNRLDYWIVSELHGMFIAQQQGYASDIVRALRYKNMDLYMLCNKHMDKQRIELYNKLNKELDNDGTMEKLMHKYGIK